MNAQKQRIYMGLIIGMMGVLAVPITIQHGSKVWKELLCDGGVVWLIPILFGIAQGIWYAQWESRTILSTFIWGLLDMVILVVCMVALLYRLHTDDILFGMLIMGVQIIASASTLAIIRYRSHVVLR